jgi:hypothetical protein
LGVVVEGFWVDLLGFLMGVLGNVRFSRGSLLVSSWWLCGGCWLETALKMGMESTTGILTLFLGRVSLVC